jgi:hypothetical protein
MQAAKDHHAAALWGAVGLKSGEEIGPLADPFGTDSFGSWDNQTQMYWSIRLTALTDPTSALDAIEVNEETLA